MTATVPQQGPPVAGGPTRVRRLGIVYGYPILDLATGVVRTDYVGQTIQTLAARDRQHRGLAPNRDGSTKCQPWSDLIVGQPYVIEQGFWTAAKLDERERYHIATLRPRYNVALNYGNPDRIKPWEAQAARAQRDAARGVPPRLAPSRDVSRPSWVRLAASRVGRRLRRKSLSAVRAVTPWVALWLALTVAGLVLHVPDAPTAAAGVTVLGLLARVGRSNKKKRRRRR